MSGFRTNVHRGGWQVAQCPIQDFFKKGGVQETQLILSFATVFMMEYFIIHDIMMYAPLIEFLTD